MLYSKQDFETEISYPHQTGMIHRCERYDVDVSYINYNNALVYRVIFTLHAPKEEGTKKC